MSEANALQDAYNILVIAYVLYGILTLCSVYILVRATFYA